MPTAAASTTSGPVTKGLTPPPEAQAQSISFTAPASGTVGDSAALSATASSGLPVVLSIDPASGAGVCTLSGSTVTYNSTGICIIEANQAGNATYAAAPQVQQTITVTTNRGPSPSCASTSPSSPTPTSTPSASPTPAPSQSCLEPSAGRSS